MTITWLCEILSFYFTSAHLSPILFLDIINALQGVFIFLLFVCLPQPFSLIREHITRAYKARAQINDVEMTRLNGDVTTLSQTNDVEQNETTILNGDATA